MGNLVKVKPHQILCALLCWGALSGSYIPLAWSQPISSQPIALPAPEEDIHLSQGPLEFGAFLEQVKANHPALQAAELERKIASAYRLEKQGAFDPSINGYSQWLRYNSSSDPGKDQKAWDSQVSLDLLTRQGAKVSLGGKLVEGDVKTPLSPTGDGGEYFAEVKLPLLRDGFINPKSAAEKKAFIGEDFALAQYREKRLGVLLKSADVYWKWVAAANTLSMEEQLLTLAENRYAFVFQNAEAGDMPKIDIVEATQEVQKRKNRLVKALRKFQEANYALSLFIWDTSGQPGKAPERSLVPNQLPAPAPFTDDAWVQEGRIQAIRLRPELQGIQFAREMAKIDLKLAKNQLLPQLDVFYSQGMEFGDGGIGPVIKGGVALSVPVRRRTAKGQLQQADLKIQKLTTEERQWVQTILTQVDDSVSAIRTAYDRYQASHAEWTLAQEMENAERTRFDLGDSTLFLVNQRERATAEAYINRLEAITDYQVSMVLFQLVTGQL